MYRQKVHIASSLSDEMDSNLQMATSYVVFWISKGVEAHAVQGSGGNRKE